MNNYHRKYKPVGDLAALILSDESITSFLTSPSSPDISSLPSANLHGCADALWLRRGELQAETVPVRGSSSSHVTVALLACADAASLPPSHPPTLPHDATEAGLAAPGSQYLTHPPWMKSWKGDKAVLRGRITTRDPCTCQLI